MKEAEKKKKAQNAEKKDKICTTGGPTQRLEDVGELKKKFQNQKLLTKLNLEKQMQMQQAEVRALAEIEKTQERQEADMIAAKHLEAKLEKERKKKETLDHY